MKALEENKLRLRETTEHYLRLDAMERLRGHTPGTVPAAPVRGGLFWRYVFVPVYRRIPWAYKQKAMAATRMTATGWTPPKREPSQPWRPPVKAGP